MRRKCFERGVKVMPVAKEMSWSSKRGMVLNKSFQIDWKCLLMSEINCEESKLINEIYSEQTY